MPHASKILTLLDDPNYLKLWFIKVEHQLFAYKALMPFLSKFLWLIIIIIIVVVIINHHQRRHHHHLSYRNHYLHLIFDTKISVHITTMANERVSCSWIRIQLLSTQWFKLFGFDILSSRIQEPFWIRKQFFFWYFISIISKISPSFWKIISFLFNCKRSLAIQTFKCFFLRTRKKSNSTVCRNLDDKFLDLYSKMIDLDTTF